LTRANNSKRLGDLLTAAGVLKLEQLQEAIEIARQQSLPVGRVLIMYGYLSGLQLQAALHLQSMLKDDLIDYDIALKVLELITAHNIPVKDALQQIGWEASESAKTNKLGELLMEAGIINDVQLSLGLKHSTVAGMPLGRVLVNLGIITEKLLSSALTAQVLIREQRISREKAIQGLMAARERQISFEQSVQEISQMQLPPRKGVRLGQLLVMAGILDEKDLMHALELGLVQEQPIGRMLLSLSLVSEENLLKALEAQALVADGMGVEEAASILTTAIAKACTISHASSLLLGARTATKLDSEAPTLPMYQLLQLAGLMGPQELALAVQMGTQDTEIMSQMLQKASILDSHLIAAAASCADLITKRVLKPEQAIMILNHCKETRASVYEFFDEFGWSRPPLPAAASQKGSSARPVNKVGDDKESVVQPIQDAQARSELERNAFSYPSGEASAKASLSNPTAENGKRPEGTPQGNQPPDPVVEGGKARRKLRDLIP